MIRVIKKLSVLIEDKNKIIGLVLMMIVGAFLEVLGVGMMVPLVMTLMSPNIINENKYVQYVCTILHITSYKRFILLCVGLLIAVYIGKNVYLIIEHSIQYRLIYGNRFRVQKKLLESYLNRPYEFFLEVNSGEIVRTVTSDVITAYSLMTSMINLVTESVVSFALIATVFVINPIITLATAVSIGVTMLLLTKKIKPGLKRAGLKKKKHLALTNQWLLQAITGIKDVKVAQSEAYFQENYDKSGRISIEADRKYVLVNAIPKMLIEMVSICSVLLVVVVLVIYGMDMEMLMPALSAFCMAALKILPSANQITNSLNAIAFQEPALDKLLEELKEVERNDGKDAMEARNIQTVVFEEDVPKIELRDIEYHYPNISSNILDKANMVIPIGKSVGIVGASGAGKTTTVDILLGLLEVQKGQVLYRGRDIREDYSGWLNRISYIPQTIFMLDDSIRANVIFGKNDGKSDDEEVWTALREAQLEEFVKSLPNGLDTMIGERGVRISGGQRQRIGIARALYTNPEILVFDEATSALDNETEESIMEAIDALKGRKTMVIIAHRLSTIENCDIVYRVENGQIVVERGGEYV